MKFDLKCWMYEDCIEELGAERCSCMWEARRIFHHVLGCSDVAAVLKNDRVLVYESFVNSSLDHRKVLLPSRRAFKQRLPHQAIPTHIREEWQLSTSGMLAFLFLAVSSCREKRANLAMSVLQGVVSECVSEEDILNFNFHAVREDILAQCASRGADGMCGHMRGVLVGGFSRVEAKPHDVVLHLAKLARTSGRACCAVWSWFAVFVQELAKHIDGKAPSLSSTEALDFTELFFQGAGNKRRTDEDYKKVVVEAAGTKRGNTVGCIAIASGKLAESTALDWAGSYLASYRASGLLTFESARCVSICFDASRLGNPKEETLHLAATNCFTDDAVQCPPQVPNSKNSRVAPWYVRLGPNIELIRVSLMSDSEVQHVPLFRVEVQLVPPLRAEVQNVPLDLGPRNTIKLVNR